MSTFAHAISHVRKYRQKHWLLYIFSFHTFFISTFIGIIAYMIPIVFLRHGLSQTEIGLLIASSAVIGAVFDIILAKVLSSTYYRHLYLFLSALCFLIIALMWTASSISMFFMIAAATGLFYDIFQIGTFDFVSREMQPQEHASSFGVINVLKSLGLMIAPLALAFSFSHHSSSTPYWNALLWAGMSMAFFALLIRVKDTNDKKKDRTEKPHYKKMNFLLELHLWEKIGKQLLPVLLFTFILGANISFFWTLAPLFSEQMRSAGLSSALFIPAYILPTLLVGWFVGPVTKTFGKKNTAYWSFIVGSIILGCVAFVQESNHIVLIACLSSIFGAFSNPALSGAFADYLSETPDYEKDIDSLGDFFTNLGAICGPIAGGVLADAVGIQKAFSLFSIFSILMTLWIIKKSPKKITISP